MQDSAPGSVGPRPSDATAGRHRYRPAFGDFEIVREVGRGGMGVVYEAHQVSLDRRVALKVLHGGFGLSANTVARFQREAQAAARLHHPNVVPIYEQGEFDGNYYYAMELIDGTSLDRLLRTPGLGDHDADERAPAAAAGPPRTGSQDAWSAPTRPRAWYEQLARMMAEVADGLHYAHVNGVIHRDIKPHNLVVSSVGRICITDFGLARVCEEPGVTLSGELLGSPLYMAPEQITGGHDEVTALSDVYSLGATLYQVLTCQPPFQARARDQVIALILSQEPTPPRRVNVEIPYALETICLKALSKEPRGRYKDAAAMASDLRRFSNGERIRARRPGPVASGVRLVKRHKGATGVVAAAVLLIVAGVTATLMLRASKQTVAAKREVIEARSREIDAREEAQETEAMANEAEELVRRGEYEEATKVASELIERGAVEGAELLAQSYAALGEYEKAIWVAERFLPSNPLSVALHGVMAELYQSRDPERARLHRAQALRKLDARSAEFRYLEALDETDVRGQLDRLDALLRDDPYHFRALEHRAVLHFEGRDYAAMRDDAQRLVALRGRDAYAWALHGAAHLMTGDGATAAQSFQHAISLNPGDARIYQLRANAHLLGKRYEEAIADATQALEAQERSASVLPPELLQLPELSQSPGGEAGVPQRLGRVADPVNYRIRAEAALRLGRWSDCAFDCDRAIELGSRDFMVYMLRAAARASMDMPALALRDVQEALRLGANPNDEDVQRFSQRLRDELGLAEGEEAPEPF